MSTLAVKEIRASGLAQIMQCSGPLVLEDQLPNETNEAAEEGTAAGELFQAMLEQKSLAPIVPTHAKNGVRFDEDMYFYLRPHAEEILSQGHPVLCETRIDWRSRSGILMRGQYDAAYLDEANETLNVDDLKYGYGIVDVFENWQLLDYSIGEVIRLRSQGKSIRRLRLRIHQPRAYHAEGSIRAWSITTEQLMEYYERIEKRMEELVAGDKTLRTGSKCKYCKAAPVCPAFNAAVHSALDFTLGTWVQDNMSNEQLASQLVLAERATELLKIRIDSLNQLGVIRVRAGAVIPGRGIKETYGHRKWKKVVDPKAFKILTGVDITETTVMSPAKVEKLGVPEHFIDMLAERPFNGAKLVPMDTAAAAEKVFGKR